MPETIVIQGRNIPYTRGAVSVDECVLDPKTPEFSS